MQTKVLSDHGITPLKSVAVGRPVEHVESAFVGSWNVWEVKLLYLVSIGLCLLVWCELGFIVEKASLDYSNFLHTKKNMVLMVKNSSLKGSLE